MKTLGTDSMAAMDSISLEHLQKHVSARNAHAPKQIVTQLQPLFLRGQRKHRPQLWGPDSADAEGPLGVGALSCSSCGLTVGIDSML